MGLSIEKKLTSAFQTLLEVNNYITAESIPVVEYGDMSEKEKGVWVVVRSMRAEEEFTGSNLYAVPVEIYVLTHIDDDKNRNKAELTYEEILFVIKGTTNAEINAELSGLVFNGREIESGEEPDLNNYHVLNTRMICHINTT